MTKRSTYRKADAALERMTVSQAKRALSKLATGEGGVFLLCIGSTSLPMARVTVETFDRTA